MQQPIQNSYFVGGTNFAYISKMGNKIETSESTRIIKQEANNNQGQMKQRIIYEIATEVSSTQNIFLLILYKFYYFLAKSFL